MNFTRFHHYEIDDWVTYAPALDIISISVGEDYIYCGTRFGGILRYHIYDNFWDYPFTTSNGLKSNQILDIVYDSQNNKIYAETIEGINQYNYAFNYWEFIGPGNLPPQRYPLSSDLEDYLQNGNFRFPEFYRPQIKELPDFFTDIKYVFRPPNEILDEQNRIFKINDAIVVDRQRNLWIGTNGLGIAKASLDDYNLTFHRQSISNITPRDLYFDKNEIWIAGLNTGNGPGGINYWNYDEDEWKYFEAQYNHGIYDDNCYAVIGTERYLFFGSQEGLIRYDKKSREWKTFTTGNGLESNKIYHLHVFKNNLFIATDEGFNWMTPNYNQIEESGNTILDNVPVYKIVSSKSLIYMATKNGVYTYNMEKDQIRFLKTRSASLDLYISAINFLGDSLWIAGKYGITLYDGLKDSWQSFPGIQTAVKGDIHAINFTKGNVWFATDNGLLKYDIGRDFWYLYTVDDGLADNEVFNIIPDSEDLWLCTKKGVCIFRWYRENRIE
jgi:ligand-binding sensor domain-containing protein